MSHITIDPEFAALIPPLTADELAGLEADILARGCRSPLDVWGNTLVDGHNRYAICKRHNIPYETKPIDLEDRNAAIVWIINNQLARRNLVPFARVQLALKQESVFAAQAKVRMLAGVKADPALISAQGKPTPTETRVAVAQVAGVGHDTVAKVKVILEKATPEVKEVLSKGDMSINAAYKGIEKNEKQLKRLSDIEEQAAAIAANPPEIPIGPFHVISLDPPWPYGTPYDPAGRRAANPYPEMSLDEIKAIELPAADDCVLWLWTTHKFMRHSFDLLDAWGFRDVAIVTWVKDRMGLGSWLRSQSEFCIMAVKGTPPITLINQTTVIHGPLREHSRKPDSFYDMVDSLCAGAKLDYFSREKREGWYQVGNTPELFKECA